MVSGRCSASSWNDGLYVPCSDSYRSRKNRYMSSSLDSSVAMLRELASYAIDSTAIRASMANVNRIQPMNPCMFPPRRSPRILFSWSADMYPYSSSTDPVP